MASRDPPLASETNADRRKAGPGTAPGAPYTPSMPRSAVGLSAARDPAQAGEEAARGALAAAGLERAQAALCFATPHFGPGTEVLLESVVGSLGTRAVVGSWTHGLLACGLERAGEPAVAVLAISGIEAHAFLLTEFAGDEPAAGEEILERMGGPLRPEDLVVLLPDSQELLAAPLLASVRDSLGPAQLVGAGSAVGPDGFSLQWAGEKPTRGALAGMLLRGARPPRLGIASVCRRATELMRVTRARGHWILELDGRPALEVYRRVARAPLAADLRRAAEHLLVAIPRAAEDPDSCVVRNPVGFDAKEGAFAVPDAVKPGQQIALVLRDPEAARLELKDMLARTLSRPPCLGLYFSCRAGGGSFLGAPGLEAAYLQNACGSAPVLGIRGAFEFGPVAGRPELLTHAAVLALVDG